MTGGSPARSGGPGRALTSANTAAGGGLSVPNEQSWPAPPSGAPSAPPSGRSRAARWALRRGLWRVTQVTRLAHCGRYLVAPDLGAWVALKEGAAYYSGLKVCGSIWICPVCAARIRQRRAMEIERAAVRHLGAGGGVGFGTFTLPHTRDDDLAGLLGVLQLAWKMTQQNRAVRRAFERHGIFGRIRATEVTYGTWHGWHPHLHLLFFAELALTDEQWADLLEVLSAAWAAAVVKLGRKRPADEVGVTLSRVQTAAVGQYLAKVQDHYGESSTVGLEMARGDAKKGRKRSRTPFELAEQASQGLATELELWWAYEEATKGRRAIEWSRGLKARFEVEEVTDEELAAADVDGEPVVHVDDDTWGLLVGTGKETHLLDLVEQGGAPAAHEFLLRLRTDATSPEGDS